MDREGLQTKWRTSIDNEAQKQRAKDEEAIVRRRQEKRIHLAQSKARVLVGSLERETTTDLVKRRAENGVKGVKESRLVPLGPLKAVDKVGRSHGFAQVKTQYRTEIVFEERERFLRSSEIRPVEVVTDELLFAGVEFFAAHEDGNDATTVHNAAWYKGENITEDDLQDLESSLDLVGEAAVVYLSTETPELSV